MHRSLILALPLIVLLALAAASCSYVGLGGKPPAPPVTHHTATMELTPGIAINGLIATPPGFTPIAGQQPMWLQDNKELALAGTIDGRTQVLGFSGAFYKNVRLIAADGGPGAPKGKIVGLAASPDGQTLAVAEAEPGRIEIVLRYVISNAGQNSIASFDGNFHAVSLNWTAPATLAVGLAGDPTASSPQTGGLYFLHVLGAISTDQVNVACPLSTLAFSPDVRFAVGEGSEQTPPSVINLATGKCRPIGVDGPIKVLGWATAGGSFLYSAPAGRDHGAGVFRYTIAGRKTAFVAVSSGAAAYVGAGVVMALGNSDLNFQRAASLPDQPVTAQLASFDPKFAPNHKEIAVDSLGMPTTPAMMMASTMTYSRPFAQLALQLFVAGPGGPTRKIVTFSIIDRKAFVLASGPVRGVAVIGWSPVVNHLVIFDGDGTAGAVAVITPQR